MSGIFIRVSVYALAALLLAGVCATCSTKRQKSFTGPDWPGPAVWEIDISPKSGPYYSGASVDFIVNAAPTHPSGKSTLSYEWNVSQIGEIVSGDKTNRVTVALRREGLQFGSVKVTESIAPGVWKEVMKSFDILIEVICPGYIAIGSLTYNESTRVIAASYSDADGDDLTVGWDTDAGTVTPLENDNTTATAMFIAPFGEGVATVTFWVSDGLSTNSDTIAISYMDYFDLSIFEDSVFLIAPMTVRAGEQYDVSICAWPSPAKPLGNLNAVRLLVDQSKAVAQSINRGGFFDGFDGIYFPPLLIQQPTFLDVGINFGGGTTMSFTRGILATVTFVSLSPGDVTFDIMGYDGAQNRTFYSDLDGKTYTFYTIGKDYGSGFVTSKVVVNVK